MVNMGYNFLGTEAEDKTEGETTLEEPAEEIVEEDAALATGALRGTGKKEAIEGWDLPEALEPAFDFWAPCFLPPVLTLAEERAEAPRCCVDALRGATAAASVDATCSVETTSSADTTCSVDCAPEKEREEEEKREEEWEDCRRD
jgi:hypothetical protein